MGARAGSDSQQHKWITKFVDLLLEDPFRDAPH